MNKQLPVIIFITCFLCLVIVVPQISYCQTSTPEATATPSTGEAKQGSSLDLLLIVGIAVIVAAVAGVAAFVVFKRKAVSEKSLRKVAVRAFEEWVIKRFNGKPSDPSLGISGFTEGGQPLLIKQSDVTLAEVEGFVDVLIKGRAQKGTIVAFNFDKDTIDGKVKALDNEIDLQLLPVYELFNKRYANKIKSIASSQVTFEASAIPTTFNPRESQEQLFETETYGKMPLEPHNGFAKPRVFISNSNTKIADQVKKMLDFLHYDYVMGDKEETTVPISDNKFGLMRDCDCAIINIAAAEQERRYSGIYLLNSNVTSEINAAYLKYNTQVVLLVERKVELPLNLKGLKRIEYDSDDLSFNAAMDLEKALADFKKI
jgi:hypothetical protein